MSDDDDTVAHPAEVVLLDGIKEQFSVDWPKFTESTEAAADGFVACSVAYSKAHRAHVRAVGAFRNWRANAYVTLIKEDPKAGEWKARAVVEAQTGYMQHKERLAHLEHALLVTRAACVILALAIGADAGTPILITEEA